MRLLQLALFSSAVTAAAINSAGKSMAKRDKLGDCLKKVPDAFSTPDGADAFAKCLKGDKAKRDAGSDGLDGLDCPGLTEDMDDDTLIAALGKCFQDAMDKAGASEAAGDAAKSDDMAEKRADPKKDGADKVQDETGPSRQELNDYCRLINGQDRLCPQ